MTKLKQKLQRKVKESYFDLDVCNVCRKKFTGKQKRITVYSTDTNLSDIRNVNICIICYKKLLKEQQCAAIFAETLNTVLPEVGVVCPVTVPNKFREVAQK